MKPIVLTEVVGGTYSEAHDEPIYVNPELIVCFRRDDNAKTWVVLNGQRDVFVREAPAEIVERMGRQRAALRAEERDGVLA